MLRNLDKSAALISSFKQVASDQSASPRRRFDLALLVADVGATLAPALKDAHVALRVEIGPALVLDTFPVALADILSHLVLNAVLHGCGEGGAVAIEARPVDGDMLELCVRDDGGGIPAAHLEKIFDPFFTTKLGQGSCGLGLNIVHNLAVSVLGGSIQASSAPGDTRFLLRFPRKAPQLAGTCAGAA